MITDILETNNSKIKALKVSLEEIDLLPISEEDKKELKEASIIAAKDDLRALNSYKKMNLLKNEYSDTLFNVFETLLKIKLVRFSDNEITHVYYAIRYFNSLMFSKDFTFLDEATIPARNSIKSNIEMIMNNHQNTIINVGSYDGRISTSDRDFISQTLFNTAALCNRIIHRIFSDEQHLEELALINPEEINILKKELLDE